ncbi:hypothetical protein AB0K51_29180 [Kitasatospora sp. NPDC049285]|uniref:hypothetical protein n=1 Tax=Kitasatospora sp. NPDC049285 TaxID=3157096 RepID=UPI0034335B9F
MSKTKFLAGISASALAALLLVGGLAQTASAEPVGAQTTTVCPNSLMWDTITASCR